MNDVICLDEWYELGECKERWEMEKKVTAISEGELQPEGERWEEFRDVFQGES